MDDLVAEAEKLAREGVNELILVAQETTLYGTDIYNRKAIGELIDKLATIDGIEWIRLMYCYPEEIGDGLIVSSVRGATDVVHSIAFSFAAILLFLFAALFLWIRFLPAALSMALTATL